MQHITITAESLKANGISRVSDYIQNVINNGHIPGVLSGSELKGTARKYGSRYAATRAKVSAAVKAICGVESAIVDNKRIWTLAGEPVELTLLG